MINNNVCYCCGNQPLKEIYSGLLLRCSECGHTIAHPKYFDSDFSHLYSEKYFTGDEYLDYLSDRSAIQRNFDKHLAVISKKWSNRKLTSVVEIGAAYGFFGDSLKKFFPEATYTGFEISSKPTTWARKNLHLDIRNEDYTTTPIPKETVTDIFMWDVIEHLPDPALFLQKANTELTSGGRIYITTGDIAQLLPTLQGHRWRMIHPPTHLHYFTKNSLQQLLRKNGFKTIHGTYPAVYRSLRQIWFSLFFLKKRKPMVSTQNKLFIGINTFDIMFLVAEKE